MRHNQKLMSFLLCMIALTTCNITFSQQAYAAKKKSSSEQSAKAVDKKADKAADKTTDNSADKATAKTDAKAALIDINTASKEDLMKISGVGTRYSDEIIKGRPYKSKNQLVSKKILPEALYKSISDKIIAKQGSSK